MKILLFKLFPLITGGLNISTREETRQLRLEAWKQIFADHAASGLSVKAYCEANNIKKDQYFYWQSIARKAALAETPEKSSGFALLEPPKHGNVLDVSSPEPLPTMIIDTGKFRISLAEGIRKEQLAAVLGVIANAE